MANYPRMLSFGTTSLALALVLSQLPSGADACSHAFIKKQGLPAIGVRTLEWIFSMEDFMFVNPRGSMMDGGLGENDLAANWTVLHGSVTVSGSGWLSNMYSGATGLPLDFEQDGAIDGVNERGLAVHALEQGVTVYAERSSVERPGISALRWVRYLLDTCATVEEAVAAMDKVTIVGVSLAPAPGQEGMSLGVHVAVEDRAGEMAIFEIIGGELRVHRRSSDAGASVMTNAPEYPWHLENTKRYKSLGGELAIPGDVSSSDRFVRLSYYAKLIPDAADAATLMSYMLSAIGSVEVLFGAPDPDDGVVYSTYWTSAVNHDRGSYSLRWFMNPHTIHVELPTLALNGKFEEGAPTLRLNPRQAHLSGDVSELFSPAPDMLV